MCSTLVQEHLTTLAFCMSLPLVRPKFSQALRPVSSQHSACNLERLWGLLVSSLACTRRGLLRLRLTRAPFVCDQGRRAYELPAVSGQGGLSVVWGQ